jgi:hypothetical protein
MTTTDAARDPLHDRVTFLKRLTEDDLMSYVDGVLEHHGSINLGIDSPADHETNTSRTNRPPR